MGISRRSFLETAGAAGVLAGSVDGGNAAHAIPTRILGRTGARVTILAMGGGSRFLMNGNEEQCVAALNRALDLGINYVDSASSYGDGLSEIRVGKVMKHRRKGVFLVTKIGPKRGGDDAMRIFENSLKSLQTDHVDLLHVHGLMGPEDLARVEAKDGVLNRLLKLRDEKATRFIGVTCHHDPAVLKAALERHDFDCVQMALNAARVGESKGVKGTFESIVLPVAQQKKMGILCMKAFGQDKLKYDVPPSRLLQYVWSLPISAAVVGMPKIPMLEANVAAAKAFHPMPKQEMDEFARQMGEKNKIALDRFFAHHIDC